MLVSPAGFQKKSKMSFVCTTSCVLGFGGLCDPELSLATAFRVSELDGVGQKKKINSGTTKGSLLLFYSRILEVLLVLG